MFLPLFVPAVSFFLCFLCIIESRKLFEIVLNHAGYVRSMRRWYKLSEIWLFDKFLGLIRR